MFEVYAKVTFLLPRKQKWIEQCQCKAGYVFFAKVRVSEKLLVKDGKCSQNAIDRLQVMFTTRHVTKSYEDFLVAAKLASL